MKRGTTLVTVLASLLAAMMLLSACGSKKAAEGGGGEGALSAGPVAIEFWYAVGGKGGEKIQELAERFNNSQQDVKVTATYQGDYYANHQKISAGIAADTIPAMSMVEVASMAFFADNGALADIGALAKGDEAIIKDFLPGLMKEAYWKEKLVAIPFNRSTPILYLNKNALKEAGLNPEGPKTWEELRAYAKRLHVVKDGQVERWGFLTPVDIWFYEALVYQQGGTFISPDGKKAAFNDEAGQSALQFWVDLIHTDKVMEMPQGEKYNAWDVSTKAFTSGKAAMIFSTTGRLLGHIDGAGDKFEVGTAFLPAGKKGYGTPTGGANLVILAKAPKEQQQAAWKFMKWLSQPEIAAEWSKTTGYVPVNNGGVKQMEEHFKKYPQFLTAVKQLEYAQPRPQHPAYAEQQESIMKALQKAVLKEQSVKDALNEAATQATKSLK